jgi:hypothetical protein
MICSIIKPFYEPLIRSDSRKSMTDLEDRSGVVSPELEHILRGTVPIYGDAIGRHMQTT